MTESEFQTVLTPASTDEVVEIIRSANGVPVCLSSSPCMTEADALNRIDLQNMKDVVEYPARDMTITVQAGMTVAELKDILAEERQQLPIDAADSSTTLGAVVAGDIAGPRQFRYGTIRDYLIGMEAVDGQGRVFHAGGRVVKNVAGYDLCRLMVGSRGTLAALTQLTFKLKPIPEHSSAVEFSFSNDEALEQALERLNLSAASPVINDFHYDGSSIRSLFLSVEGNESGCAWQIEQLRSECETAASVRLVTDSKDVDAYCAAEQRSGSSNEVKISTLPSKLVTVAKELADRGFPSSGHAGNGILFVKTGDTKDVSELIAICREITERHSGHASHWTTDHPASKNDAISVRLRKTFDPDSVFVC